MFYGGAKGGGKSDFLLADYLEGIRWGEAYHGVIFRRTYPELEELIKRADQLYRAIGGVYIKSERTWKFPAGSTLKFRYLEADQDVHQYQGHQYQWIGFDELTSWPTDFCYTFMFSCARSPDGIPVRIRATGNPGMVGHLWVKNRFVDVGPPGVVYKDSATGVSRVFIPARLEDNPYLFHTDYETNLRALAPYLYKAFRWGDWDVLIGQVFQEFRRASHVVRAFPIEPEWFRFASMDWGYAKPFSIGWWCVTGDGRVIRYKEWYGCEPNQPNVGLRMEATEVARRSFEMSINEGCKDMVADRACWNKQGVGRSVAEIFNDAGWNMLPSISDRANGIAAVHDRLMTTGFDGQPMLMVFETCKDWVRTVPVLVADPRNPEDVDTRMEDHCLHGDTMVTTESGMVPIRRLVGMTGRVRTINGDWDTFRDCRLMRRDATVKVGLASGRVVRCTPDHKFLLADGSWCEARHLMNALLYDRVAIWKRVQSLLRSKSSWVFATIYAVATFSAKARDSIWWYGKRCMGSQWLEPTSTMPMATAATIARRISWLWRGVSTFLCTLHMTGRSQLKRARQRQHGTAAGLALSGTRSNTENTARTLSMRGWPAGVSTAESDIPPSSINDSVLQPVGRHGAGILEGMTLRPYVNSAGRRSRRTSIAVSDSAHADVLGDRVVSVIDDGYADTYCLVADTTHAFDVADGLIVSNCFDETKYALLSEFSTRRVRKSPRERYQGGFLDSERLTREYNPLSSAWAASMAG